MKRFLTVFMALAILFASAVVEFPLMAVTAQAAESFTPRTTAPSATNKYYIHTSAGGVNECILISGDSVLPNCVGYAWGRAYEILGTKPKLSKGNAGAWYQYNINNKYYSYGSTPKLGAIACWTKDGNTGHVAVVEGINSNTSVMLSESNYGGTRFRYFTANPNTYCNSVGYTFQGYIYVCDFGDAENAPYIGTPYTTAIGETTATIKCDIAKNGSNWTRAGAYYGTSTGNMIKTLSVELGATNTWVSYNMTALTPGTTYYYKFYIETSSKTYESSVASFRTTVSTPDTVTGFMGTATANSITLNWNKSANATSYKLQQSVNGVWQTIASPTGTTYTVTGLIPDTEYTFRIFALNGSAQSSGRDLTLKTIAAIPAVVTGFSGTASVNSITLRWNKSANATSYKLQQSVNGAWQTIASPTGTTYTVSGLKANTAYNFRIFARNNSGQSNQTKLTVSTLAELPATVIGFTGIPSTNSIVLNWYKSANATEYKLQQQINGAWQTIASPTRTTYTVTGLNSNTAYNFRIFARNSSGQSAQTKLTVTTLGAPAAVTSFTGTATASSIALKWNKSANATEYKLQQSVNGAWQTIASPTGTTYTVSGLKANTAYNFRIFARNSSGQSAQTKLTVSTLGAPAAVTGFTGTATANSIVLKWNKSANATEYKLQQSINGAWQTIASPTGTTYTVTGLKTNTVYNFRIFARNSVGQSAQTKLTVTTLGDPATVTGFMGIASSNSITLNWYESANATEYKLQQMVNGAWQTIATPADTTFTVTGLNANTTYNFRIFARSGSLQSDQVKLTVKTK